MRWSMSTKDLKFTKTHEWIKVDGDIVVVGLSDYAQGELGDIVFVELPSVGRKVAANDVLTSIESVKSVSEMFAPLDGEVVEVNAALEDNPGLVNSDPYGEGWILKLKVEGEPQLGDVMSSDEYEQHTKG